jgi:hypothetical protein
VVGWTAVARGRIGHLTESLRSEDLSYMKNQKSRRGRPSAPLRTSRRYEKRMYGHSPAEAGRASSAHTKRNAKGFAVRRRRDERRQRISPSDERGDLLVGWGGFCLGFQGDFCRANVEVGD